jgi:hypothetical protein
MLAKLKCYPQDVEERHENSRSGKPGSNEAGMAVFGGSAMADGETQQHVDVHAPEGPPGRFSTVWSLMTGPLPSDVRDEELTVAALFRASLILNFLTGGAPDMTFSARCHGAQKYGRMMPQRVAWRALAMAIDAICGVLRGECQHCAAAWSNHLSRDPESRQT